MKRNKFLICLTVLVLFASCNSINVYSDYDKNVDFSTFKTYDFYKLGIDKVEISDLDKRRILDAINREMLSKGFTKSENPDLLINLFTKSREQVNVTPVSIGFSYGWSPWVIGGMPLNNVSSYIEGTLYIDFIDTKQKEMIWQGEGTGVLTRNSEKKDERINEFVSKILSHYPPKATK